MTRTELIARVHPPYGLFAHLRVPVRVEEDDRVGRLEVESQPARARREHEDEVVRLVTVKLRDELAAVVALRARTRVISGL